MTKMLVSMPQELSKILRDQAAKERRTISAVVVKAVENYILENQDCREVGK